MGRFNPRSGKKPAGRRHYKHFEDFDEFLAYCNETPAMASDPEFADKQSWSSRSYTPNDEEDWWGSDSWEQAYEMATRTGYGEGGSRLLKMRAELEDMVQSASQAHAGSYGFSTGGEFISMGRAIQGRPDAFMRRTDFSDTLSLPVVTVAMNASNSGGSEEHALFMRGAVTLLLVDVLESLGRRVELIWCACAERQDEEAVKVGRRRVPVYDETSVVIKRAADHIEIDRLAFMFCHRAGLRRFAFRTYEHNKRVRPGYPSKMTKTEAAYPDGVFIEGLLSGVNYIGDVRRYVTQLLAQLGITLDEGVQV